MGGDTTQFYFKYLSLFISIICIKQIVFIQNPFYYSAEGHTNNQFQTVYTVTNFKCSPTLIFTVYLSVQ